MFSPLAASCNSFADKMWSKIGSPDVDDAPCGGLFVSPLSISMAMMLAANGCRGLTQKQILDLFGLSGVSELNAEMQRFIGSNTPVLSIANAVFCHPTLQFHPDYLKGVHQYYHATAAVLRSAAQINAWCSEKTRGKITSIIDRLPDDVALVLINAVYFKGTWKFPFPKDATSNQTFTTFGGDRLRCRMMTLRTQQVPNCKVFYHESPEAQAVRLPYEISSAGERAVEAVVVLPRPGMDRQISFSKIVGDLWSSGKLCGGTLELPKFKVESKETLQLATPLRQLGVQNLFANSYDLAPMVANVPLEGLSVGGVLHKTVVEVDEEGTVAAAVTATLGGFGSAAAPPPQDEFRMRCDRPFYFLICDGQTSTIIFLGRVSRPPPPGSGDLDVPNSLFGPRGDDQKVDPPEQVPFNPSKPVLSKPVPSNLGIAPIPLPKPVRDRLEQSPSLQLFPPSRDFLTEVCNRDGVPALAKASQAITNHREGETLPTKEIVEDLTTAYQIFNFVQSQWHYCFGESFAHAFYNLACVQSLLLEIFLAECKSLHELSAASSVKEIVQHVGALPLPRHFAGDAIPPLVDNGGNGAALLESRYKATEQALKMAVAGRYDDEEHMAADRDLLAYRELASMI